MFPFVLQVLSLIAVLVVAARWQRMGRRWRVAAAVVIAAAFAASFALSSSFHVQKWLGTLAMPPSWIWLGLFVGAAWALRERQRRAATALLVGLAAYWLMTNTFVAKWCLGSLEGPYSGAAAAGTFDAVALLGGGHSVRPSGDSQISLAGDRIASAARSYHRGETTRILCTGPATAVAHTTTVLRELGVPDEAIVPVHGPVNTSQEIERLAALSREQGYERVGLITSAWHMRRAMRLAERHGFAAEPLPADFWSRPPGPSILEVLPSAQAMFEVRIAAWEWLGSAVGR